MGYMSIADLRAREDEVGDLEGVLTRQQQIGLMFHEEIQMRIPRSEVGILGCMYGTNVL